MRRLATLLLAAALLGGAATAYAAPVKDVTLDVQLWPAESQGSLVIVSATVPSSTPLPATVHMPLPEGAEVFWAGEITGRGASTDVERAHKVVAGTGGQVVELVATQYRQVQYEATYGTPGVSGSNLVSKLAWVQSAPAASETFAVDFDASATVVSIVPAPIGAPEFNDEGDALYVLPRQTLAPGAAYDVTTEFTVSQTGAGGAASTSGSADSTTVVVVLGVLAALLIVALISVIAMKRRRGEPPSDTD